MILQPLAPETGANPAQCMLCAFAGYGDNFLTPSESDFAVVEVNDQTIVLLSPHLEGVLVAPLQHVGGLLELPEHELAVFLASLRRISRSVQAVLGGSNTVIEPLGSTPPSKGHVCFRIDPAVQGSVKGESNPRSEIATRARALATSLKGLTVPVRTGPIANG